MAGTKAGGWSPRFDSPGSISLSWQTPWNKVFTKKVLNPLPINLQLILHQPQGHPTVSRHQFKTSAIFPDFKHLTATHSFEVLISLSESFKTSETDLNNELNVLQFWQTFNILNGGGVSRKTTFKKSIEWLQENVYTWAFHSFNLLAPELFF